MLYQNSVQKQLSIWVGGGLLVATIVFMALIISNASAFAGNEMLGTRLVSLGPLMLVEVGRESINGQTAAVITYLPGIIWYFAIFAIFGTVIAFYQSQKK